MGADFSTQRGEARVGRGDSTKKSAQRAIVVPREENYVQAAERNRITQKRVCFPRQKARRESGGDPASALFGGKLQAAFKSL